MYDEHLFVAGNDSTGTAAITYASRINSHPVTERFDNFSFPESCASHPSRCRLLTYSSTSSNYTQLIFYVPLAELALGAMEFFYNGTTLAHVRSRSITVPRHVHRCNPISVVEVSGAFYLICISDRQKLMSCKVRNHVTVNEIWLDCSTPEFSVDVSLLSNFITYMGGRGPDLFFTYANAMCRKRLTSGFVELLTYLPLHYSYCRHLDYFNDSVPTIIGYCHNSNTNQIQVVYFDLTDHTFSEQRNASVVVSYHCPSPETFVEVAIHGAYASFRSRGVYKGSFNIIGNAVTFATCFEFENSTHFLYQDKHLGTFIKTNISSDLQTRVMQLSTERCWSPACEQPYVYDSKYILLLEQSNFHNWTLKLMNIQQDLNLNQVILTLNNTDPAQLVLITNFVVHRRDSMRDSTTTAAANPINYSNAKSAVIIGAPTSIGSLLLLVVVVPSLIFLVYYMYINQR